MTLVEIVMELQLVVDDLLVGVAVHRLHVEAAAVAITHPAKMTDVNVTTNVGTVAIALAVLTRGWSQCYVVDKANNQLKGPRDEGRS